MLVRLARGGAWFSLPTWARGRLVGKCSASVVSTLLSSQLHGLVCRVQHGLWPDFDVAMVCRRSSGAEPGGGLLQNISGPEDASWSSSTVDEALGPIGGLDPLWTRRWLRPTPLWRGRSVRVPMCG